MRTMIEDLEMPDPQEEARAQQHIQRVKNAGEISFEGYLDDIESLLVETYEHYKNVPEAFDPLPVDPREPDLLGPDGSTLEQRRARPASPPGTPRDQAPTQHLGSEAPAWQAPLPAQPPISTQRFHLETPLPTPSAPPSRPQDPPGAAAPDPFQLDPYSGAPADAGAGGQPAPPPASGASKVDPFALDPYTGQAYSSEVDPFKLDPFGGGSAQPASAPEAGPQPASAGARARGGPGATSAPVGAGRPPATPSAQPSSPGGIEPGQPAAAAGLRGSGAHGLPPSQPAEAAADSYGFGTQGFEDPEFARPGDTGQDLFAWPKGPPAALQGLHEAQRRAEQAFEQFDPFAGESSEDGRRLVMGPGAPHGSDAGAGPRPPGVPPGVPVHPSGKPIYVHDSDELPPAGEGALSAQQVQQAFENALVSAGMRGMLEYQQPVPGHGASHPVMLIYDGTRKVFKAPLVPAMSVGDRFQLNDGKIFRVHAQRILEVDGTPCYQEVAVRPLGQMRMPLRDSWEGMAPPMPPG
jgi:hypothetical protein